MLAPMFPSMLTLSRTLTCDLCQANESKLVSKLSSSFFFSSLLTSHWGLVLTKREQMLIYNMAVITAFTLLLPHLPLSPIRRCQLRERSVPTAHHTGQDDLGCHTGISCTPGNIRMLAPAGGLRVGNRRNSSLFNSLWSKLIANTSLNVK